MQPKRFMLPSCNSIQNQNNEDNQQSTVQLHQYTLTTTDREGEIKVFFQDNARCELHDSKGVHIKMFSTMTA